MLPRRACTRNICPLLKIKDFRWSSITKNCRGFSLSYLFQVIAKPDEAKPVALATQ
jgi:hypothetical protein